MKKEEHSLKLDRHGNCVECGHTGARHAKRSAAAGLFAERSAKQLDRYMRASGVEPCVYVCMAFMCRCRGTRNV